MKTTWKNIKDVKRAWHLVDAREFTLGRLSSRVAVVLAGKNKIDFTPNIDMGDYVVVVNAPQIKLTGRKLDQKEYTRYSGFPGGISRTSLKNKLQDRPETVIQHAVAGMLPKSKLRKFMLRRLKVFKDDKHNFKIDKKIK